VVAGSGLALLGTEFESANKVMAQCQEKLEETRDIVTDTVERTVEQTEDDDERRKKADLHVDENDDEIVISVNMDHYYDGDNGTRQTQSNQNNAGNQPPGMLQTTKNKLQLHARGFLATNVLPLLKKTQERTAAARASAATDES
jgi:hypothetical protein